MQMLHRSQLRCRLTHKGLGSARMCQQHTHLLARERASIPPLWRCRAPHELDGAIRAHLAHRRVPHVLVALARVLDVGHEEGVVLPAAACVVSSCVVQECSRHRARENTRGRAGQGLSQDLNAQESAQAIVRLELPRRGGRPDVQVAESDAAAYAARDVGVGQEARRAGRHELGEHGLLEDEQLTGPRAAPWVLRIQDPLELVP